MPHPHISSAQSSILVVVDIQEPFAKAMADRAALVKNTSALIHVAKAVGMPIIVTEQNPEKLGPTVPEIKKPLEEVGAYQPLPKMAFSCCAADGFVKRVYDTGRDTLVITGMEGHVCIQQTTLEALNLGYKVHVVQDAVTSRRREDYAAAIEKMRHAGAIITTTEMAAYEWLGAAGTPEFKAAMQWLKW